jgi:hypothetical protein
MPTKIQFGGDKTKKISLFFELDISLGIERHHNVRFENNFFVFSVFTATLQHSLIINVLSVAVVWQWWQ